MDAVTQIKQKLDILDVVGSYITVKKAGKNYKAVCPFHSENTPSFNVSPDLQIFKCFGCGEAGDMFAFVEKIEGVDFPEALRILAEKAGVVLEKTDYDSNTKLKQRIYYINELSARFYNYLLTKHALGAPGLEYLTDKRKLEQNTIDAFLLGYAPLTSDTLLRFLSKKGIKVEEMVHAGVVIQKPDNNGYLDKFRGRVVFPLIGIDGKILGFAGRTLRDIKPKYLNTSETLVFHKGNFIYGLDKAKLAIKKEGAVLVEGNVDVISAYQAGIFNVIAASGTSVTESQLQIISRYTKDITLCLDSDTAGINAAFRAVDLAEKKDFNIEVAVVPDSYKDLDDLIRADSLEAVSILKKAVPAYDFFIEASTKLHDKSSPDGKKRIMEDLIPKFSRIHNKVLLDYYSGEIASILNLTKETVYKLLEDNKTTVDNVLTPNNTASIDSAVSIIDRKEPRMEMYFVSLLIKMPPEMINESIKSLDLADFLDEEAQLIVDSIMAYLKDKGTFDINDFLMSTQESVRNQVQDLYFSHLDFVEGDEAFFRREIIAVSKRIKQESNKRQIKDLTDKIRLAEKENDDKLVAELTAKVSELTHELI